MNSPDEQSEAPTVERIRTFVKTVDETISIRRATLHDCEAIYQAHKASVAASCPEQDTPEQIGDRLGQRQVQEYQSAVEKGLVLVAEKESKIFGYIQLDLSSGLIQALSVDPAYIGKGVGRSLLRAVEEEARAAGLRRVHLHATLNSVAFCQARGYLPLGDDSPQAGTGPPCVHMEKVL